VVVAGAGVGVGERFSERSQLMTGVAQCGAQSLDLFVGQVTAVDAAQRLALEHLTQQLEQRDDDFGQPAPEVGGVEIDA